MSSSRRSADGRAVTGTLGGLRVAVVGGGIFGCTTALMLDLAGATVDLYEAESGLMERATRRNLFRLHRGYHYPRSVATGLLARAGAAQFERWYGRAVTRRHRHLYAVAVEDSLTSFEQFLAYCDIVGLTYDLVRHPILRHDRLQGAVLADEGYIDYLALRREVERRLAVSDVRVELSQRAGPELIDHYSYVVLANYESINAFLRAASLPLPARRFDVCEIPIVHSRGLADESIVILDGPFISLAPLPSHGLSLLYGVRGSVLASYDCAEEAYDSRWSRLLGGPIRPEPAITNFAAMRDGAARFIHGGERLQYVASKFELRTVPAGVEHTDERPTEVSWVAPTVVSLFSGKISTCVSGAEEVCQALSRASRATREEQTMGSIDERIAVR